MAYVAPSLGPAGLTVSNYSDIQAALLGAYQSSYTSGVYLGTDSSDYQFISAIAAKIADCHQLAVLTYNQRAVQTAVGSGLDSLAKDFGTVRKVPSYSTAALTVTGVAQTPINNGQVRDASGFIWALPATVTIPNNGSIVVNAQCLTIGTISAAPGTINQINTGTSGWTGVTNLAAAIPGAPIENDSVLRARLMESSSLPSLTILAGTKARVAAVEGVTLSTAYNNPTNATDANGLPAHSFAVVVVGGADADVAEAIFGNRGIGPFTYGTTTVNVTDPYDGAVSAISFFRAMQVPIYVTATLTPLTSYTTAALASVQASLVAYLNSLQIGEDVSMSALVYEAVSAMPNVRIPQFSVSIAAGTAANPTGTTDIPIAFNAVASASLATVVVQQAS